MDLYRICIGLYRICMGFVQDLYEAKRVPGGSQPASGLTHTLRTPYALVLFKKASRHLSIILPNMSLKPSTASTTPMDTNTHTHTHTHRGPTDLYESAAIAAAVAAAVFFLTPSLRQPYASLRASCQSSLSCKFEK